MQKQKNKLVLGLAGLLVIVGIAWMSVSSHGIHWSYSGAEGPDHWADLSTDFEMCGRGKEQSPIDITSTIETGTEELEFDYKSAPLSIVNNGHTIQANYAPGSFIKVAGHRYELLQFHFHSPSEHVFEGQAAPMEVHFVHKDSAGKLAVVGVFIEKGDTNNALADIWKNMPEGANESIDVSGKSINATNIIPAQHQYFTYPGSLTTPPCSEGVKWMVMKKRIEMSASQVNKFLKVIGKNARPIQPLNQRGKKSQGESTSGDHNTGTSSDHHVNSPVGHSDVHWAYKGNEGPNQWASLSEDFALCGSGRNQSPINIDQSSPMPLDEIGFRYNESSINLLNNGHTIQMNYDAGSYMEVAGKRYQLLQFHFHSPSEHEFKGRQSPLEVHLVHKSDEGELAVVGVMMDQGNTHSKLTDIWDDMPRKAGSTKRISGKMSAKDLLPANKHYFFYNGSLTTPPCSEGVKWFVMQNKRSVSNSQIDKFLDVVGKNARPVQTIHERNVRSAEF